MQPCLIRWVNACLVWIYTLSAVATLASLIRVLVGGEHGKEVGYLAMAIGCGVVTLGGIAYLCCGDIIDSWVGETEKALGIDSPVLHKQDLDRTLSEYQATLDESIMGESVMRGSSMSMSSSVRESNATAAAAPTE